MQWLPSMRTAPKHARLVTVPAKTGTVVTCNAYPYPFTRTPAVKTSLPLDALHVQRPAYADWASIIINHCLAQSNSAALSCSRR